MANHHEDVERYEKQVHELQTQVKFLEEEVGLLRRRLTNAPRQVTLLEEKLVETREPTHPAMSARTRSSPTPCAPSARRSRRLAEEVEKLSQPPASFGVYLAHQRGRVDRRVHRRSQDAGDAGPRHRRASRSAPASRSC